MNTRHLITLFHMVLKGLAAIVDGNIRSAVDMWLTNRLMSIQTFGDMNWWDTSAVTDMSRLFCGESLVRV